MALHQLVLFFLFLHCGRSDCQKIRAVYVQKGQSAIIPCLYEKEHENDTKLWCKEVDPSKCAAGVSISDDITQRIFTVNMTNIRHEDAGRYCCTVKPKTKQHQTKGCTRITISNNITGRPMLSVLNPMISEYESGTASVLFQHSFPPGSKRLFCQLAGECVGWDSDSGSLNAMAVMLSDVTDGELKVTLSGLQRKNTGWYVCDVWGFQTPVHLNVTSVRTTPATESPVTTAPNTDQCGMVRSDVLVPVRVVVFLFLVLCGATVCVVQWRRGRPMLSVLNPMIIGYESGTASVLFQHSFPPKDKRQFCQLAGECVGWDSDSGSLNGMAVMLTGGTDGKVKVTLSGLQRNNTGWYVFSVGGYQIPVHLNVTGTRPTPVTGSPETHSTDTTAPNTDQHGMVEVLVPIIVAVLVLIVLCAAAVVLLRWRRGKTEAPQQAAANANSASADPEVVYADVMSRKMSPKHASPAEPSDQVTYSTLRTHMRSVGEDTNSNDLTYGNIIPKSKRKERKGKVSAAQDLYSEVRVHHK
ncbi:uncharacterized protein LOC134087016 [Sardina pilchardus]|uniref:uncharacterized protein LOC134087016 n=1 Tax=Sardina pilchardus TaxID=27697 RepID=UPI002E163E37